MLQQTIKLRKQDYNFNQSASNTPFETMFTLTKVTLMVSLPHVQQFCNCYFASLLGHNSVISCGDSKWPKWNQLLKSWKLLQQNENECGIYWCKKKHLLILKATQQLRSVWHPIMVKFIYFREQQHGASDSTWQNSGSGSDVHHWLNTNIVKIYTKWHLRTHLSNMDCIVFLNVLHNFSSFFLFLSVLSFGLLYGSFYNEVVLCDDQKLWCSSIVFKYLMSLKIWIKICLNQWSCCSHGFISISFYKTRCSIRLGILWH